MNKVNTLARYTMIGNWAIKDANGKGYIGREVDIFIACQQGTIRSLEADLEVMDNRVEFLNDHNKELSKLATDAVKISTSWEDNYKSLLLQRNILLGVFILPLVYNLATWLL